MKTKRCSECGKPMQGFACVPCFNRKMDEAAERADRNEREITDEQLNTLDRAWEMEARNDG